MYSSPNVFVKSNDCMNKASENSSVEAAESTAGAATAVVACDCEATASGSVGASVGLPIRLAVVGAFVSYEGG